MDISNLVNTFGNKNCETEDNLLSIKSVSQFLYVVTGNTDYTKLYNC